MRKCEWRIGNSVARRRPLFPLLLARGIAGVARCLALRFKRQFAGGRLFFFARELCGGLCRSLSLTSFLLGLGRFACQSGLGALGGPRPPVRLALSHPRVVEGP